MKEGSVQEWSYTCTLSSTPALDWGGWYRHDPAVLSRRFGVYRVGKYWCGKCRPQSGPNPGSSSPKRIAITTALSLPRAKECRPLRKFPTFVEEGSHWRPTDGFSIQTTFWAAAGTTVPTWPWPLRPTSVYCHSVLLLETEHLEVTRRRVRATFKTLQPLPVLLSQRHQCGPHVSGRCRGKRWYTLVARWY
jgi:hypothetical protein